MRLQVNLLRDVRIGVLAKVMLEQRQRHHQRHYAEAVLIDDVHHFLFVFGADHLFQITADVQQHVAVRAARGAFFSAAISSLK